MKISSDQLDLSLKKGLSHLYLISGDEVFFVNEAKEKISRAIKENGFDQRQSFQINRTFNWQSLLKELENFSLFSEKTLFELQLSSLTLTDEAKEIIVNCAKSSLPDHRFLLIAPKLDSAALKSTWVKTIEQEGCVVQCWPLSPQQLPSWIKQRLQKRGLNASVQAIQFIAEQVEGNLLAADQEIEKLSLLYPNQSIGLDEVMQALSDHSHFDIFALIDYTLAADVKRVLTILQNLKSQGEEPTIILWAITKELRALYKMVKEISEGNNILSVMTKNYVWEKRKPFVKAALLRLSSETILSLLQQAHHIDKIIKGAEKGSVWQAFEILCLKISGINL